jgi:hypothetical protein
MLTARTAAATVLVCGLCLGGAACESMTDGGNSETLADKTPADETVTLSRRLEDIGKTMKRGEKLVTDGRAEREKGLAMKEAGKTVEGEKLVAQGEAKIREGQTLLDEARRQKQDTLRRLQSVPEERYDQMGQRVREQDRAAEQQREQDQRRREQQQQPR